MSFREGLDGKFASPFCANSKSLWASVSSKFGSLCPILIKSFSYRKLNGSTDLAGTMTGIIAIELLLSYKS